MAREVIDVGFEQRSGHVDSGQRNEPSLSTPPWRAFRSAGRFERLRSNAPSISRTEYASRPSCLDPHVSDQAEPQAVRLIGSRTRPRHRATMLSSAGPVSHGQLSRGSDMTTASEGAELTQVGPGTAMGQLMRHYWLSALMTQSRHGSRAYSITSSARCRTESGILKPFSLADF